MIPRHPIRVAYLRVRRRWFRVRPYCEAPPKAEPLGGHVAALAPPVLAAVPPKARKPESPAPPEPRRVIAVVSLRSHSAVGRDVPTPNKALERTAGLRLSCIHSFWAGSRSAWSFGGIGIGIQCVIPKDAHRAAASFSGVSPVHGKNVLTCSPSQYRTSSPSGSFSATGIHRTRRSSEWPSTPLTIREFSEAIAHLFVRGNGLECGIWQHQARMVGTVRQAAVASDVRGQPAAVAPSFQFHEPLASSPSPRTSRCRQRRARW